MQDARQREQRALRRRQSRRAARVPADWFPLDTAQAQVVTEADIHAARRLGFPNVYEYLASQ